ncbi:sodium:calcium antiporter [Virgibacillus ainsalahensis]
MSAFSAIRLATHANEISTKTKMGGFLAGTLLLAGATSLPELTATISAGIIGNADIAVGNGLGSILFNFFVLFMMDLHFRKKRLFLKVSDNHLYTGVIALLLCMITAVGLAIDFSFTLVNISMTSVAVAFVYILGMWFVSRKKTEGTVSQQQKRPSEENISLKRSISRFVIYALIIFASGSALSISGDAMVQHTGLSATLVGSILVALATSFPDAMSTFTALRLTNVNMAIGTILGSNVFNLFVITIGDVFYFNGSIWHNTSNEIILVSLTGFFLTAIVMLIIKRDYTRNTFTYIIPSLIAVISYIAIVSFIILG